MSDFFRQNILFLMGIPFQACIILSIFFQAARFRHTEIPKYWIVVLTAVGSAIVHGMMYVIYVKNRRTKKLITNGLFQWTRHPMYTGFVLLGMVLWYPTSAMGWSYWGSLATFTTGILVAGWLQERETLQRFDTEAEEYYRRTPRVFLLYPIIWLLRRKA